MLSQEDKKRIKKVVDLSFLWGSCKNVKTSTEEIMKEIDEGEVDE